MVVKNKKRIKTITVKRMCLGHYQTEDLGAFLKSRVEGRVLMKETKWKKANSINYTRGGGQSTQKKVGRV